LFKICSVSRGDATTQRFFVFTSRGGAATQRFFVLSHAATRRRNVSLFCLTRRRGDATFLCFVSRGGAATQRFFVLSHAATQRRNVSLFLPHAVTQ